MKIKFYLSIFISLFLFGCTVGTDTYSPTLRKETASAIFSLDVPRKIRNGYTEATARFSIKGCNLDYGNIFIQLNPAHNNNNKLFTIPADENLYMDIEVTSGIERGFNAIFFKPLPYRDYKISVHLAERRQYVIKVYEKKNNQQWKDVEVAEFDVDNFRRNCK